jgi:serine protease inhibitor
VANSPRYTQYDENAKDTNVLTMMIANDINVGSKKEVQVMECPWYKDGMCVFDVEKSECIEEFTCMKCNANPGNREYTPLEMEQPDFCR